MAQDEVREPVGESVTRGGPIAHILAPSGGVGMLQWLALALVALAGAGLLAGRRPFVHAVSWTLLVLAGATIVGLEFVPAPAGLPGYSVSILQPSVGARTTSPVRVVVCGRSSGAPADLPGPGRVLAVLIDGREAGTTPGAEQVVTVAPGRHRLRVEILTAAHRELQPSLGAEESIEITGVGSTAPRAACPR